MKRQTERVLMQRIGILPRKREYCDTKPNAMHQLRTLTYLVQKDSNGFCEGGAPP
jgi:hypothetical protein